jgi:hypothetical protein
MKCQRLQDAQQARPQTYQRPALTRWGTLRELTQGGGGTKKEPQSPRRTRF